MSLHEKPEHNTDAIKTALLLHRMEPDKPALLSDAFRLGWAAMKVEALEAIANLPPSEKDDIMSGHEDAYRVIENI